jgi:hypothetical protein
MGYVLFVCTHNAGHSQMAQAFFEKYAPADLRACGKPRARKQRKKKQSPRRSDRACPPLAEVVFAQCSLVDDVAGSTMTPGRLGVARIRADSGDCGNRGRDR